MHRPPPSEVSVPSAPPAFWRRACVLIVGLVLARGVAILCVLPPFEGWDEYQHVAYVERMAQGGDRPVLGEAEVSEALLRGVVAFPQSHTVLGDGLAKFGAVGYAEFWAGHDPHAPGTTAPAFRPGTQGLYQAQHGPLFYQLAAPLFRALGGARNLRASVGGLRLANVLLTAAAVALALTFLKRVTRSERVAVLLTLPLAAHPLFLLSGARVANDALGLFTATVAVGAGLAMAVGIGPLRRRPFWGALALGAACGISAQAKATNLALVPFAAACWGVHAWRARDMRAIAAGLLIVAAFLALAGTDLAFNEAHYGSPTAMQEALLNRHDGRTSADLFRTAASFQWIRAVDRLWSRELYFKGGWSFLPTPAWATFSYQFLVHVGLLGGAAWSLRRVTRRRWRGVPDDAIFVSPVVPAVLTVVALGYTVGIAYHMTQSKLAWGVPTTCPWYAAPALPWFLALVTAGGIGGLPRPLREVLPWALAAVGLAGEVVGVAGSMVPTYTGHAAGWQALARLAWLQPAGLGTLTLAVALLAETATVAFLTLAFWDEARSRRAPASPNFAALTQAPPE